MLSCEGVILAAGLSTRAGCPKMELPLGDKVVIQRSVESMAGVVSRVIVVVGWGAERIRQLLAPYNQVEIVPNDDFRAGMFSSVKAGIAHVQAESFFLLPGDHPLVRVETYRRLLMAGGEIAIPSFRGRKGHPVLVASRLIPEILAEPGESSLREYIGRVGFTLVDVPDEGVTLDIDTMDDYRSALQRRPDRKEGSG